MRRLIAFSTFVVVAACASAGQPPGGPERKEPPRLIRITPDSNATNVRVGDADFRFDEVVTDRPAKGDLDQYFLVSPRDGAPRVSWHRTHVSVRPRHGFRPNTAYTVTMLPGIADMRGNVTKQSTQVVFSTGPTIPRLGIVGRVFDWVAQRPVPNALVQAVHHPDSVVYVTTTDSLGNFDIGPFGPGTYTVYGIIDANGNRERDPAEAWDSVTSTVDSTRNIVELLAIQRDSVGPAIDRMTVEDSARVLRISFTRPLQPDQPLRPSMFRIQRADSSVIPIASVRSSQQEDSARADSVRKVDSARAAARPPAESLPAAIPALRRPLPRPVPKPSKPPPPNAVLLTLAPGNVLEPVKSYRVAAIGVRNVVGIPRTSERILTIPRPAPVDTTKRLPNDSTRRAPRDTVRRPPPTKPPPGR